MQEQSQSTASLSYERLFSILGICSGCVVIALVFSMVNTALPQIQKNIGITVDASQWMMNAFGIINCAVLVTCGRLADVFGRKRLFMIGLLSSLVAMIGGGFSQTSLGLIVCMVFAGIGNAIILPVSQALLVTEFSEHKKGLAIGIWASAIAAALATGPVLGGVISASFGWQWIYWINVPVIITSFILIYLCSKESRNTEDPPDIDYKGMVLLGISIASLAGLITEYSTLIWEIKVLLVLLFSFSLYFLWRVERKFPQPILREDLLCNPQFLAASLANASLVFYIWAVFFLLPLYLQSLREVSSLTSGWLMLGVTLPVAILSPAIGRLYAQETAGLWIAGGFFLMLISTIFQGFFHEETSLLFISLAATLFGVAYSFIWGPSTTAAVSNLSVNQAGVSTGTFVTIQEIGGILGLACIVAVAKGNANLMHGFQHSMWVLCTVGVVGIISGLFLYMKRN